MSIVSAYGCDYCGQMKPEKNIVAVSPVQDMFDNLKSYPSIYRQLDRFTVHYCVSCYTVNVSDAAEKASPRRVSADLHTDLIRQYGYVFRLRCLNNQLAKKFFNK